MSWQGGLGKPFLAALSILISLTLWLVVQSEITPVAKEFDVPLDMERAHLPEGLVLVGDKAVTVHLKANGPADLLEKIKPEDLKPFIDLTRAGPITKSFAVKMDRALKDKDRGIEWDLGSKTITIEQVMNREMRVNVVTTGVLRDQNMFYVNSTVEPDRVTVSGPATLFKQARSVRVFFDLGTIGNGNAQTKEVEILDENNRSIGELTADPKEVIVRPVLGAANQHRILFVTPSFQGTQPEFGYKVSKVAVTPAQVEVSGSSEALARLRATTLETMKIDLTGLTQSTTFSVDLDQSQFRNLKSKTTTVKVHVQIDPITSVPPLKPLGP